MIRVVLIAVAITCIPLGAALTVAGVLSSGTASVLFGAVLIVAGVMATSRLADMRDAEQEHELLTGELAIARANEAALLEALATATPEGREHAEAEYADATRRTSDLLAEQEARG